MANPRVYLVAVIFLEFFSSSALPAVYRIGPGETYLTVSEIAGELRPGDIVEITGDIEDAFTLSRNGTKEQPITVRGLTTTSEGVIQRPKVIAKDEMLPAIVCKGDWIVIEGLELKACGSPVTGTAALVYEGDNTIVRNCRFHHGYRSIYGKEQTAGSILVEFCEFDSNGYGSKCDVNLYSAKPASTANVRFCYFHDASGGLMLRSCCPRNIVYCNWFENPYKGFVQISTVPIPANPEGEALASMVLPEHADITGNVFLFGFGGSPYAALQLGGDSELAPGTEGEFNMAHNLIVTTKGGATPSVPILVHGNVDKISVWNNMFLEVAGNGCRLYVRGDVWPGKRRDAFVGRRGSADPVLEGSNNCISESIRDVPAEFEANTKGVNPGFANLASGDYRPVVSSPLRGGGRWPVPNGRIGVLLPEHEPRRGIPVGLEPLARRKATPPSIGPFEVAENIPTIADDSADIVLQARKGAGRFAWPLHFGRARRKVNELLAAGNNEQALEYAKMHFLLCPTDEVSLNSAVDSVERVLSALDGDSVRASAFRRFALGESGEMGNIVTNWETLLSPIEKVGFSTIRKPAEIMGNRAFEIDLRAAVGTASRDWPYRSYEQHWYRAEKAFDLMENADFDSGFGLLLSVLAESVGKPAADIDTKSGMQRNWDILGRVAAGLSVFYRFRCGSAARVDDYVRDVFDFCRYGLAGPDGCVGSSDDADVGWLVTCERSKDLIGESPSTHEEATVWNALGYLQAQSAMSALSSRLHTRVKLAADWLRLAEQKYALAIRYGSEKNSQFFLYQYPTASASYRRAKRALEETPVPLATASDMEKSQAEIVLRALSDWADATFIEEYRALRAHDLPDDQRLKVRAYLSGSLLAVYPREEYGRAIQMIAEKANDGALPVFLLEDSLSGIEDPFLAGDVFASIDTIAGGTWNPEERRSFLSAIRQAQSTYLKTADARLASVADNDRSLEYDRTADQCRVYCKSFPDSEDAVLMELQTAYFEFRAGNLSDAIAESDEFLRRHGNSEFAANAAFMKGVALFAKKDFAQAAAAFDEVCGKYAGSRFAGRACYMAGTSWMFSSNYEAALARFKRVLDFYPGEQNAENARRLVKSLELRLDQANSR